MSVQTATIPIALAGRTITTKLKPPAFSPDGKTIFASYAGLSQISAKAKNAYSPQYNRGTERKLDMELFKYSTPFGQGAEDAASTSLENFSPGIHRLYPTCTMAQKAPRSFRYASTSNPANRSSWADRRFRTMVMGKIENAKIYPEIARKTGIEGDVFVRLSISSDGKVGNVELLPPTTDHQHSQKICCQYSS